VARSARRAVAARSHLEGDVFSQAFQTLRKICADTLFQPETPDTPIQVLACSSPQASSSTSLGHRPDRRSLAAEEFANPFLPLAQQRKAGIPEASAETSLALDRRITDG